MLGIVAKPEMAGGSPAGMNLAALLGRGYCRGGRSSPIAVIGRS